MAHWTTEALETVHRGEAAMLVLVCAVEGSAPRDPGAVMLVTASGMSGSIGGGALELSALKYARDVLKDETPGMVFEDYPLGPALGQCCGGFVRIGYYRFGTKDEEWLVKAASVLGRKQAGYVDIVLGKEAASVTFDEGPLPRSEADVIFLDAAGEALTHNMPHVADCARLRIRIRDDHASVYIFGAGHVGQALVCLLQHMPAEITWIDRRTDQFPKEPGGAITVHQTDRETELVAGARVGACFFVLTHDHALDYELVSGILQRPDTAYCGLIGSKTKRARFAQRLLRDGIDAARVENLICPIGGEQLTSKAPEMIALAAVHEMFIAHEESIATQTSGNMSQRSVRVGN